MALIRPTCIHVVYRLWAKYYHGTMYKKATLYIWIQSVDSTSGIY